MTVRIDLKQTKTIMEGPVYRVFNQVTYAHDIPGNVFVFNTETQVFEHVATLWDLQNYPLTRVEAVNGAIEYYLDSECFKDYADIQAALDFTASIFSRVDWLVRVYAEANGIFEGVVAHTITG